MEDITKATGELITSFTDFTTLAPAQREEIAKTATMMKQTFGVANADFAKGIQFSTKMMGMGASDAATFQKKLLRRPKHLVVLRKNFLLSLRRWAHN